VSGSRWEAGAGCFGVLGGAGINALVKHLVGRPRPIAQLVHVQRVIGNPSYPAGHVLNFTVFAGFLCYLVHMRMQPAWGRDALLALLLGMIALMGIARIASGEHWPSDVLGGYLLGALWLGVTVRFYRWGRRAFARARKDVSTGARLGGVVALALLFTPALATSAPAASADPESLGASTGVPWNPPHAMARRRVWEEAMLLPGQLASLPLSGLGRVSDNLFYRIEQNPRFATVVSTLATSMTELERLVAPFLVERDVPLALDGCMGTRRTVRKQPVHHGSGGALDRPIVVLRRARLAIGPKDCDGELCATSPLLLAHAYRGALSARSRR